jgi:hypothetical protein
MFLEIAFLLVGLSLSVAGIGTGLHYYRARNWYLKELSKANDAENIIRTQRMQVTKPIAMPKTRTASRRTKSK